MSEAIWKATNVSGTLSWGNAKSPALFDVECDRCGRLSFSFSKLAVTHDTFWLWNAFHSKGRYANLLTLHGVDAVGQTIHTDYFQLTRLSNDFSRHSSLLTPSGTTSWLEVTLPTEQEQCDDSNGKTVVRYRIVGIEGFDVLRADCKLGQIKLAAFAKVANYDEMTGLIDFVATDYPSDMGDWTKQCDKKVDMILEVLSLAEDRRVDWSIKEVFLRGKRSSILFVGPHSAPNPQCPIFSSLHLQPAVDIAVHVYTDYLRDKLGMGFAIEYFLMRPYSMELQFIAAMTGLEHMLQRFASIQSTGGIISSSLFHSELLPPLRETLRETLQARNSNAGGSQVPEHIIDLLVDKLGEINRTPQRENLFRFLEHYKIPLAGISDEEIKDLVRVRNDLAHGRQYRKTPNAQYLSDHLSVLHELMRRVFLTLLQYRGDRWTFLHRQEWVKFPPCAAAETRDGSSPPVAGDEATVGVERKSVGEKGVGSHRL